MEVGLLSEAADLVGRVKELVGKAATVRRGELPPGDVKRLIATFGQLVKLGSAGSATAARLLGDPATLARANGTSMGKAREALKTAAAADKTPELGEAFRGGELSWDQATEIAKTEQVAPGSVGPLLERVRGGAPVHVLKEDARKRRLEAQDRAGLAQRQHEGRFLRHGVTDNGNIRLEAELEPHVGTPLLSRLQAEAKNLSRDAKAAEPFERYLADALPKVASGSGRPGRTEMVILVSHGVAERGWLDVQDDEFCKIPGVGPITPEIAKRIAEGDAFLTGLFYDGEDLRQIRRWGRHIPAAIQAAVNLGEPPGFEGRRCIDCGNRFFLETDHLDPRGSGGETALDNLKDRCDPCHDKKTRQDREAGLLGSERSRPLANAPP